MKSILKQKFSGLKSNVKKAYKYLLNFNIETYPVDVIGQV